MLGSDTHPEHWSSWPTFCRLWGGAVQDQGDPAQFITVLREWPYSPKLELDNYKSGTVCLNKTVEWAGTVAVTVATTKNTPVANTKVSCSARAYSGQTVLP